MKEQHHTTNESQMLFPYSVVLAITLGMSTTLCVVYYSWAKIKRNSMYGAMWFFFTSMGFWSLCELLKTFANFLDSKWWLHILTLFSDVCVFINSLWLLFTVIEFWRGTFYYRQHCHYVMARYLIFVYASSGAILAVVYSCPPPSMIRTVEWTSYSINWCAIIVPGLLLILSKSPIKSHKVSELWNMFWVLFLLHIPQLVLEPLFDTGILDTQDKVARNISILAKYLSGAILAAYLSTKFRGLEGYNRVTTHKHRSMQFTSYPITVDADMDFYSRASSMECVVMG